MPAPNLTHIQAQERAELLKVESYDIDLDLTNGQGGPGEKTFGSKTRIRFTAARPGESSWIDLVAAEVHSATLNGSEIDISNYREDDGVMLSNLAEQNELVIDASCRYMNTGEGLHRFVDPVDNEVYLYTQFETADAKRMFACFDQPDLKSVYRMTVIAPDHWNVVSNARVQSSEKNSSGARKTAFAESKSISTYLVALIAGPYAARTDVYTDEHGSIPLGIYCRASLAEYLDEDRLFTETKQGFAFYHKNFGVPYPFEKYDQIFVPEFNAGAMENAGAVTFLEDYVFRSRVTGYSYERRAETLLHEMAHMWFGDLVTMRWWDDLWLNESFATWASIFCQAQATEYKDAWTTFANIEKSWAYQQDMLPSTHPIAAEIVDLEAVEVNFDGITYAKGASVLKQLVAYVGEEHFLAGLRLYFTRHAWKNASFSDLLGALEEASGRDLSGWGAQWLQTTGLNFLQPRFELDQDGKIASFQVLQGGAEPGAGELRTHRIAVGIYDDNAEGKLVRVNQIELDITDAVTEVPQLIGADPGKLVLVNDDDLTYCALRLDPRSLAVLTDRIADIAEPLPRTLCWSAAWEMTREAELKARDFVSIVANGIHAESAISVVQRILLQAQLALNSYSEPKWSLEQGWPSFTERLLDLAISAKPGSDHQLAFVNALTNSVLNEKILNVVSGWWDGSAPLDGLAVDTDLRWRLLKALVAHGKAGEEEIAAQLASDETSAGQRQAATTRALIPLPQNKSETWERIFHDEELSNAISESLIAGFPHPNQTSLIAEYTSRYFQEVRAFWDKHSVERAQPTVSLLFPRWAVAQSTVDLADAFLTEEHPPALKRLVSEGRARTARALEARAFDSSETA